MSSKNIDDQRPTSGPIHTFCKNFKCHNSATRQPIPFFFGSWLGFSGTADQTAPFPVRSKPRWQPTASLKTSNGHISAMRHPIDFVLVLGWGFQGWRIESDRMAPFLVRSNPRRQPAVILENFKWSYLSNALSD